MHCTTLLCGALLAVLPLLSRARPEGSIAPASTSAPSNATEASSTILIKDLLAQLVSAENQALIATRYLAALQEVAIAAQNAELDATLKQAQDAAVAEQAALAKAQALAESQFATKNGESDRTAAKPEAQQQSHQIRQAADPARAPTCNLLSGDKSKIVASRKAFTYDAINKGSKDSVAALLNSAIAVYTTLRADIATSRPLVLAQIDNKCNTTLQKTDVCGYLAYIDSAINFALGSLNALAIDNQNRKSAFAAFFTGATVIDFTKYAAVETSALKIIGSLEGFGVDYRCGKAF